MPGQRPILAMSFIASLGITFAVLSCTVPKGQSNFYPLLVMIFLAFIPLPLWYSKRLIKVGAIGVTPGSASFARDLALFVSTGLMTSCIALPIVLTRSPESAPLVAPIACVLIEIGNVLCMSTLALFYIYFSTKEIV